MDMKKKKRAKQVQINTATGPINHARSFILMDKIMKPNMYHLGHGIYTKCHYNHLLTLF